MSLVPQKLLTIGIPTVVAVLSILWFRNRRKGQHHPVDHTSIKVKKEILDENSSTTEIITIDNNQEDICMSVEDTVTIAVETSNNNNLISGRDSGRCMKYKDSLCDSNSSKVIEAENIVIEALPSSVTEREVNSLKKPVEQIINFTVIPESASAIELEGKQGTEISEIIEGNELSTSEIFSVESEVESEKVLGEIESQKELGEIEMKKDKEQLQESINTLDLNKMKEAGELVEKLASLELDQMKMDERKEGSERDSANHSPSEIMLASPSISNFSDAHSEGSSDSGKGQSDGATSPSRTPAGGSSLAGDQAPSVYEFVLPQVIVGRLIGRHGVFLNEIKTQTHTNIFIKRHPDSNKLKVCAIEGTPQDIDKALTKIRQKFPVRRFPELTLEKVSFVQVNPLPPLKPEDFHLQLVEGVNNDVVLSSLISAAHFFLQQPCHPSYSSLVALNSIMTQIYSSGEAPILEAPVNYAVCAAPALEGWYRAQIVNVEDDGLHCTIKYLDYGGYSRIAASDLRQIRGDLLALPFQAVECYLANVVPPPGEDWSEEARLFVHGLTCGQILHAQVYDYAEDGAPLVYLYTSLGNQVVLVNEALVVHGYGVISESSSCGATSEEGGRTDEEAGKSE